MRFFYERLNEDYNLLSLRRSKIWASFKNNTKCQQILNRFKFVKICSVYCPHTRLKVFVFGTTVFANKKNLYFSKQKLKTLAFWDQN